MTTSNSRYPKVISLVEPREETCDGKAQSPQVGDFRPNHAQVTCRELAHLGARALSIIL